MTDYIHDAALVADSASFQRAPNASITVYDADDATNAVPLVLKDLNGLPLTNPLTSSQDAFTPAFITSSAQVKLVGGGLTVVLNSFQGLREDALAAQVEAQAAKTAAIGAQAAAETAGAEAAEVAAVALAGAVEDAETAKAAAEAAAALVGAPADTAISTAINAPGSATRTALNATYVPSDPGYDIVILAGQSNMAGRGTPYGVTTDPSNPRILQYKSKAPNANTIATASEPLDMHDSPSGIGPGMQFARWYASRRLGKGRKVLLVPTAHGGTPLVSSAVPLSWRRGVAGNLYANMVTQSQGALAAANAENAKYRNEIVAFLWCQGETDGDNNVTAAAYQADFDAVLNGVRTDLGISDLPIVVQTMAPQWLSSGNRQGINAVHRETPMRIARADVAVGASGLGMNDGNHYDAAQQRTNGRTVWDAYERITEGLSPYFEEFRPAQVTGVNSYAQATTTLRVLWNAAVRATGYVVEYRVTATGGAWTTAGTTTSATTLDITGLTQGTQYDVRVTGTVYGVSGTPSATIQGTPDTPPLTAGVTATAFAAYSPARRIKTSYTGPLLKLRRSTDNVEQDFGFDGSGNLDQAAITTFLGAADGLVTTLYDQSGNNRHLAQATAAAQPKAATAGTVFTSGSKPALSFDGADDVIWTSNTGLYAAGSATICAVTKVTSPGSKRAWGESNTTQSGRQYALLAPDHSSGYAVAVITAALTGAGTNTAAFNGSMHQLTSTDTGTAVAQWVDGATDTVTPSTYTRGAGWVMDRLAIGGVVRSGSLAGIVQSFSEWVAWTTVLSTTDRQTVEANQKAFYGTP